MQVGTPRYMSPEILESSIETYDISSYSKVDVYAAGLVLWEILSRTEPPSGQQNTIGEWACASLCLEAGLIILV